ncbi:hypothetical protein [Nocardia sp. BMG51109]|uniref:hypothetical protein n=1 Tax=Nocardia sp. BMG51109 TaxID=1056816 RepID=UPI0004BA4345|nr:hypothetical protein [Nocardia sp. BMG51109]
MSKNPYHLFLVHNTQTKHRVFAVHNSGHTQLKAVATFDNQPTAACVADALNEMLRGNEKASGFLEVALTGVPSPVKAEISRVVDSITNASYGLYEVEPWTKALGRYQTAAMGSFALTDPTDDDYPSSLTPRTMALLHTKACIMSDEAYMAAAGEHGFGLESYKEHYLPESLGGQGRNFITELGRCFDHLRLEIEQGEQPDPTCIGEEIALWLMIEEAELDADEHRQGFDTGYPLGDNGFDDLPAGENDYDYDTLSEILFQDHDFRAILDADEPYADGALDHIFVPFLHHGPRDPEVYPHRQPDKKANPSGVPTWKDSSGPSLLTIRKHFGEGTPLPEETTIFLSKFPRGGGETWAEGLARHFRAADELRLGIDAFANRGSDGELEWVLNLETEPSVYKEITITDDASTDTEGTRLQEFSFEELTRATEWAANEAIDGRETRMWLGIKEVPSTEKDGEEIDTENELMVIALSTNNELPQYDPDVDDENDE